MSQNQAMEARTPAIVNLDPEAVGQILINLGAAAALAGHEEPYSTVSDYCRVNEASSDELRFVRDMFSRKTAEIANRWYGGRDEAARLAVLSIAEALAP